MSDDPFEQLARESLPDLSKIGKQLDISEIPPVFVGEIRACAWELEMNWLEDTPERSTINLYLFFPILPFIKFVIPFAVPDTTETGFRKFVADMQLALKFFEEKLNGEAEENSA